MGVRVIFFFYFNSNCLVLGLRELVVVFFFIFEIGKVSVYFIMYLVDKFVLNYII